MIRAEVDLQPYAWLSEDHEEGKLAFRDRGSKDVEAHKRWRAVAPSIPVCLRRACRRYWSYLAELMGR